MQEIGKVVIHIINKFIDLGISVFSENTNDVATRIECKNKCIRRDITEIMNQLEMYDKNDKRIKRKDKLDDKLNLMKTEIKNIISNMNENELIAYINIRYDDPDFEVEVPEKSKKSENYLRYRF